MNNYGRIFVVNYKTFIVSSDFLGYMFCLSTFVSINLVSVLGDFGYIFCIDCIHIFWYSFCVMPLVHIVSILTPSLLYI